MDKDKRRAKKVSRNKTNTIDLCVPLWDNIRSDMKNSKSNTNALNTRAAQVSSLLTVGLAVLGPGMKLPKAWADVPVVTSVTSEAGVAWSDTVAWSAAGMEYDSVPLSFNVPVTAGLSLTVSSPSGMMDRRDQDSGWMGCFTAGEALLWKHEELESMRSVTEPITVSFSSPVLAVGTQIQSDPYGAYTGWIEAFDVNDVMVGSYSVGGNACYCSNGNVAFVGIEADMPIISYVRLGVSDQDSFAIGHLNILAGDGGQSIQQFGQFETTPVPEAGPVAAAGVFGLLFFRWFFFRKSLDVAV
jgi:hypothetical protein